MMRGTNIERLVKELFITYIEESERLRDKYHFSTICETQGGEGKPKKTHVTGLFPQGYPEHEVIRLKYLRGTKKRAGAMATLSPELEIKEGTLADCIRLFKLNSPSDPYIFRLYSSSLHRERLFRDGAISIYPNSTGELEPAILELIRAIEDYFIHPQCMIYSMDINLLDYIDKNHLLFTYPFLSKLLVYLKHTKHINENEMYALADKRFADYKHRAQIIRLIQTESIQNAIYGILKSR